MQVCILLSVAHPKSRQRFTSSYTDLLYPSQ